MRTEDQKITSTYRELEALRKLGRESTADCYGLLEYAPNNRWTYKLKTNKTYKRYTGSKREKRAIYAIFKTITYKTICQLFKYHGGVKFTYCNNEIQIERYSRGRYKVQINNNYFLLNGGK